MLQSAGRLRARLHNNVASTLQRTMQRATCVHRAAAHEVPTAGVHGAAATQRRPIASSLYPVPSTAVLWQGTNTTWSSQHLRSSRSMAPSRLVSSRAIHPAASFSSSEALSQSEPSLQQPHKDSDAFEGSQGQVSAGGSADKDAAGLGHASPAAVSSSLQGTVTNQGEPLEPGLYIVATPIGNLDDITLRALKVLQRANLILAEDTRHTQKLLNHFNIRTRTLSCHAHNEQSRVGSILQRLQAGEPIALVSDAGTPGISDPGHVVITAAIEAGVKVIAVPGACAFVAALVASGLPTTSATFVGFLPPKQGARRARLAELKALTSTLLFYAPPHGLAPVLSDMAAVLGPSRRVCVAREITKRHEEMFRSTLAEAAAEFESREAKGEICVVVEGCTPEEAAAAAQGFAGGAGAGLASQVPGQGLAGNGGGDVGGSSLEARALPVLVGLMKGGMPMSAAAKTAAKQLGVGRKELYDVALRAQAVLRSQEEQGGA